MNDLSYYGLNSALLSEYTQLLKMIGDFLIIVLVVTAAVTIACFAILSLNGLLASRPARAARRAVNDQGMRQGSSTVLPFPPKPARHPRSMPARGVSR